jgi:hypothetical protein
MAHTDRPDRINEIAFARGGRQTASRFDRREIIIRRLCGSFFRDHAGRRTKVPWQSETGLNSLRSIGSGLSSCRLVAAKTIRSASAEYVLCAELFFYPLHANC